jgi:hypothetical protein
MEARTDERLRTAREGDAEPARSRLAFGKDAVFGQIARADRAKCN